MRKYLLPNNKNAYKANLHTHTTISDGKCTPEEVKEIYKAHGYSVVAFTDHDVFIPHNELTDAEFLALNGYEMEVNQTELSPLAKCRKTSHMCLVARKPDMSTPVCWHRTKYLFSNAVNYRDKINFDPSLPDYERVYSAEGISNMMRLGAENGFFVSYNHPTWSCEDYSDYIGFNNMHAMEIVNNCCLMEGYPEHNERVYDDMLRAGKRIFCTATDDCHTIPSMCGAYIVLLADKLEYETVTDALMRGDFYSSEAPEIRELYIEDGVVTVKTSEAAEIRFSTGIRKAKLFSAGEGETLTEASYELPSGPDVYYFRITVTDKCGRCAYTNAYFTDELN